MTGPRVHTTLFIVAEVLLQTKGMPQLMRAGIPVLFAENQRPSAAIGSCSTSIGGSATDVHDDQHGIGEIVERPFDLARRTTSTAIETVGIVPVHAMDGGSAVDIGFNLERRISVSIRLHLLGVETLKIKNPQLHRIDHFGAIRPVVRQEQKGRTVRGSPTFRCAAHLPAGRGS